MPEDPIRLQTRGVGGNPPTKGLKVCLDHGKMDYNVMKGRTPRVEIPPTFLEFRKGMATVGSDLWPKLKAKTRSEAIEKIVALPGYGTDFFLVGTDSMAGGRVPAEAAK